MVKSISMKWTAAILSLLFLVLISAPSVFLCAAKNTTHLQACCSSSSTTQNSLSSGPCCSLQKKADIEPTNLEKLSANVVITTVSFYLSPQVVSQAKLFIPKQNPLTFYSPPIYLKDSSFLI